MKAKPRTRGRHKQMRSRLEQQVAKRLDDLGIKFEYEAYVLEYLKPIRGAVCCECHSKDVRAVRRYTPDFWLPDHGFFIEVKGKFGQVDRMKMRLVVDQHPNEDIRMLFSRNNLIGRKAQTSTRYIDYAQQYGMKACVLEDIEEWFK